MTKRTASQEIAHRYAAEVDAARAGAVRPLTAGERAMVAGWESTAAATLADVARLAGAAYRAEGRGDLAGADAAAIDAAAACRELDQLTTEAKRDAAHLEALGVPDGHRLAERVARLAFEASGMAFGAAQATNRLYRAREARIWATTEAAQRARTATA